MKNKIFAALLGTAAFFGTPAYAATAPSFSIADVQVNEGTGFANLTITKSASSGSYSRVQVTTTNGTATAINDYQSVNTTLTFSNKETSKTITVPIVNDTTAESNETFNVNLRSVRNALIARSPGVVTIIDNDGDTGTPTPTPPPPTPTPPPVPTPNPLTGETPIADNWDTSAGMVANTYGDFGNGSGVAPISGEDVGAFRMICMPGPILKDDPIVYPDLVGASHAHQFIGNTGTNAHSNYNSLRTTGTSTCTDSTAPANRSAMWIPAMMDGHGHYVKTDFARIYYKRLPATSPGCTDPVKKRGICIDLPNGLRYVFGYNMKTGMEGITDPNSFFYWLATYNCNSSEDGSLVVTSTLSHTLAEAKQKGCPVGAQMIVVGFAEDCWDGVHLDTTDHRSHMSYATGPDLGYGRQCDAAHPYLIPDLQFQWHYTVDANFADWHLSSDEMVPGAEAGSTLHMDYWEAWSPAVKTIWQQHCINGHLTCSNSDLGNGFSLKGGSLDFSYPKGVLVDVLP